MCFTDLVVFGVFFFFFNKLKARPSARKIHYDLLYCSSLDPNPQYLQGIPVLTDFPSLPQFPQGVGEEFGAHLHEVRGKES